MNQGEFQLRGGGASQCDLIQAELAAHAGEWVSVLRLHQISGSLAVHSRINDLRSRGLAIEQQSGRRGRLVLSQYRLNPEVTTNGGANERNDSDSHADCLNQNR